MTIGNYYKVREEYDEFKLDVPVPEVIRDIYVEAFLCFLNDFYYASRVMGRKALEVTLEELNVPKKGRGLKNWFKVLCKMNILYGKTQEIGMKIKWAGDIAAHRFDTDPVVKVLYSEKEAREQLQFLKAFLHDIQPIEETKRKIGLHKENEPNV